MLSSTHFGSGFPAQSLVSHVHTLPCGSTVTDWHVDSVEWEPGVIRWRVDGVPTATQTFWGSCSATRDAAGMAARSPADIKPWPPPFDLPTCCCMWWWVATCLASPQPTATCRPNWWWTVCGSTARRWVMAPRCRAAAWAGPAATPRSQRSHQTGAKSGHKTAVAKKAAAEKTPAVKQASRKARGQPCRAACVPTAPQHSSGLAKLRSPALRAALTLRLFWRLAERPVHRPAHRPAHRTTHPAAHPLAHQPAPAQPATAAPHCRPLARLKAPRPAQATSLAAALNAVMAAGVHGLCFSPNLDGQNPGTQITEARIHARLQVLAPHTRWQPTFLRLGGDALIPRIARQLGCKTLVGAWLGTDAAINQREIDAVIAIARAGHADIVAVGNGVLLREDVDEAKLLAAVAPVQQAVAGVPVGTVETCDLVELYPRITAACGVLLCNCDPFWEGCPLEHAIAYMHNMVQRVQAVVAGKPVLDSETGWPDQGSASFLSLVPPPRTRCAT